MVTVLGRQTEGHNTSTVVGMPGSGQGEWNDSKVNKDIGGAHAVTGRLGRREHMCNFVLVNLQRSKGH